MPNNGTFTLHSRALPALPAGPYSLQVTQTITAPGAEAADFDTHIEVTAPRFLLPADQVLSTFPPNQANGLFGSRLPQIVLKRRTLPWERALSSAVGTVPREVPWLALVVLADAECEFLSARPAAECVTPGVALVGSNDSNVGNAIVVTRRVIDQVFPTKDELPLLCHVRQVDLSDTELALGDDDGWLAIVLSTRLPQPGVRYRACLISLEGQFDALPASAQVEPDPENAFKKRFVYAEAAANTAVLSYQYSGLVDRSGGAIGGVASLGGSGTGAVSAGRSTTREDAWSFGRAADGVIAASTKQSPAATTTHLVGAMHGVDMAIIDQASPKFVFPVLTHWQFTCTEGADFESLMQALDVGMLGTLPEPKPVPPGAKPPAPRSRDKPVVVDTGHSLLQHRSRVGEDAKVWYRGPLVPRPTNRQIPPVSGRLPILHSSDQARRVGPDGRENLSLAAAFEIGRLLALAEPSLVAALLNWRKEAFDIARRGSILGLEPLLSQLQAVDLGAGFGSRMSHRMLVDIGSAPSSRLGPPIALISPGRPIDQIDDVNLAELLSNGFGLPLNTVQDLINPGVQRAGLTSLPVQGQLANFDQIAQQAASELGRLRFAAFDTAAGITDSVMRSHQPNLAATGGIDRLLHKEKRA